MRIRKKDADGDWVFGGGLDDFHVDVPDAPALLAVYRLAMEQGEWFLDQGAGTPWQTRILGRHTESSRDIVLNSRLLGTQGIRAVTFYSSELERETRNLSVSAELLTDYSTGPYALQTVIGTIS